MPIHLTLSSDLFPDGSQEVLVRDDLTVAQLLAEIRREYTLADAPYRLRPRTTEQALDPARTLEQQGIGKGATLVFEYRQPRADAPALASVAGQAALQADNGQQFRLRHLPALIGRPSSTTTASMLAVDLTPLDPARTSSRPHARITRAGDAYAIESLRDDNPVYVNHAAVAVGVSQPLQHGDHLRFGSVSLRFVLGG